MAVPTVHERVTGVDVRMTQIVVSDPDPLVRRGVESLLQNESSVRVVGEADSIESLWRVLRAQSIDTLLIEFSLVQVNGFRPLLDLRRDYPSCQVIVMGTVTASDAILRALRLGASGYLPKRGCVEDFQKALRQALVGMSPLLPDVAQQLLSHVIQGAATIEEESPMSELSAREMEVLQCMMQGMSNKEIAANLQVKNRTVKAHVSNILRKMDVADRTQAVVKALNAKESLAF